MEGEKGWEAEIGRSKQMVSVLALKNEAKV